MLWFCRLPSFSLFLGCELQCYRVYCTLNRSRTLNKHLELMLQDVFISLSIDHPTPFSSWKYVAVFLWIICLGLLLSVGYLVIECKSKYEIEVYFSVIHIVKCIEDNTSFWSVLFFKEVNILCTKLNFLETYKNVVHFKAYQEYYILPYYLFSCFLYQK